MRFLDKSQKSRLPADYKVKIIDANRDVEFTLKNIIDREEKVMRCNKKVLMIATTAMLGVGCIGLMGAMKYQNVKTEASDIKESEVAKVGVDVSSGSMEGETPSEGERKMDKEIIEKYNYKGYEISFIRYKDPKTGEYLSDKVKSRDYDYKRHSGYY